MNSIAWEAEYLKQANTIRKFRFGKLFRKNELVAQLYILADIVKQHPSYPQQESLIIDSSAAGSISIPAFLQLLKSGHDIIPFLVAHRTTLQDSASRLDKEKLSDKFFKWVGGAGALYGLWQILCHLFFGPVLGVPCGGPPGGSGIGSVIGSLTPVAWILGGVGLIFLQRALSYRLRRNQYFLWRRF